MLPLPWVGDALLAHSLEWIQLLPVTFTVNWQCIPGASDAPDKLMVLLLSTAVTVPPPPYSPMRPLGEETTSPAGRLSVNPIRVSVAFELGLLMVKVRLVVRLSPMPTAPNAFVMVGGTTPVAGSDGVSITSTSRGFDSFSFFGVSC